MTRYRSLVASAFTLLLSTAGTLGFLGSANAATTTQLLPPPPQTVCPPGTKPLTGPYKGLCKTLDGIIFNPITKEILSSPTPPLPVNPPSLPTQPPQQPSGGQPNSGPGGGTAPGPAASSPSASGGPSRLISSSIVSKYSYGTPYGVYFGNYGGRTTFFSPNGRFSPYDAYRKLSYRSAFGRPLNSDVSTAMIDTSVAPVSTRVPHAPDEVWLLLPFGLVLLSLVTYLVLEPDSDRVFA